MTSAFAYHKRRHAAAHTEDYVYHQLVPYLGNKRRLLGFLHEALRRSGTLPSQTGEAGVFLDLFAGSGVVARMARQLGYQVMANDWEPYSFALNHALLTCDQPPAFAVLGGYAAAVARLNALPPEAGWVSAHFCPRQDDHYEPAHDRLFFCRHNGRQLDAMRRQIERWQQDGQISAVEMSALLAPLLYAASAASNTSGVFKAFHQGWGGQTGTALERIFRPIQLSPSRFCASGQPAEVWCVDAALLAQRLRGRQLTVAYLDPPYNQHAYASNYHVLNALTQWQEQPLPPPSAPRAKSGIDPSWRRERASAYNSARRAAQAYQQLLGQLDARLLLTSYSLDGNIPAETVLQANLARGRVRLMVQDMPRYRVSRQRPTPQPTVREFLVLTDTRQPADCSVDALMAALLSGQPNPFMWENNHVHRNH